MGWEKSAHNKKSRAVDAAHNAYSEKQPTHAYIYTNDKSFCSYDRRGGNRFQQVPAKYPRE